MLFLRTPPPIPVILARFASLCAYARQQIELNLREHIGSFVDKPAKESKGKDRFRDSPQK
jgi:hypothetical protein